MVEKIDIAKDWLPRYTGSEINELGDYILLTNFKHYVSAFSEKFSCEIKGEGGPMQSSTNSDGLSIINFGIGSPNIFNSKRFQNFYDFAPTARELTQFQISGGINFSIDEKLTLNPLLIYRTISDLPDFISANVKFLYKDKLTFGFGGSNNDNRSIFFSTKSKGGLELGYGYEFVSSNEEYIIRKPSHEIFIRLYLGKMEEIEDELELNKDE